MKIEKEIILGNIVERVTIEADHIDEVVIIERMLSNPDVEVNISEEGIYLYDRSKGANEWKDNR